MSHVATCTSWAFVSYKHKHIYDIICTDKKSMKCATCDIHSSDSALNSGPWLLAIVLAVKNFFLVVILYIEKGVAM